jgi:hypothetical protein
MGRCVGFWWLRTYSDRLIFMACWLWVEGRPGVVAEAKRRQILAWSRRREK